MLSQLSVKNLAVVEKLELDFKPGMSVVTGETGAGKSILLQALNLSLGQRGDSSLVRHGKDKAEVSAVFEVADHASIQNYLKDQSLDEDGECILRRVIGRDGRSRAFVNGVSVPLSTLKGVGELLIDMHGQNEHQLLMRPNQQQELFDSYANCDAACTQLNALVAQYRQTTEQIESLIAGQDSKQQQQDFLQHQYQELEDASLTQEELDHIESDYKKQANAAGLIEKVSNVLNQLESDLGVNSQLNHLSYELNLAAEDDEKILPISTLLSSAQVQVQESVYELNHYLSSLSVDEQTTEQLEARLAELHDLARKHNCQITELIATQQKFAQDLDEVGDISATLDDLKDQQKQLLNQYQTQANKLSSARKKQAKLLSKLVTETMQVLGMPGSEFMLELTDKQAGVHYNGNETISFMVKTNMGSEFKALKKVVSGGELSRISLALSVVSSDSEYTPTLIFDEVDVGISGAVAEVVGQKLKQLSKHYQVICITHLAQVASFGHQHLRVSKTQNNEGAQTQVSSLTNSQRVDEVARILAGATITEKTRVAAEEMINKASA